MIIPALVALLFLELLSPVTIAEAAFRLVPHLICPSYLHAIDLLQWLQASFTARPGGDFIVGPICTRRNLEIVSPITNSPHHTQLMAHLEVSSHGRYPHLNLQHIKSRGGGGVNKSTHTTVLTHPASTNPSTMLGTPPADTPGTRALTSGHTTSLTQGGAPITVNTAAVGAAVLTGLGGSPLPNIVGANIGAGTGPGLGTGTP